MKLGVSQSPVQRGTGRQLLSSRAESYPTVAASSSLPTFSLGRCSSCEAGFVAGLVPCVLRHGSWGSGVEAPAKRWEVLQV